LTKKNFIVLFFSELHVGVRVKLYTEVISVRCTIDDHRRMFAAGCTYMASGSGRRVDGQKVIYCATFFLPNGKPYASIFMIEGEGKSNDAMRRASREERRWFFRWQFRAFRERWKVNLGVHQNISDLIKTDETATLRSTAA
jgi:hypothetical protein